MLNFFRDLTNLRPLLSRRDQWKLALLLALMILGSILEAIGIGAVPVFVSLIVEPSSLSENRWIGSWFQELPNEPTISIILWASVALLGFIIFKNLFLIFVYYVQARIVISQKVKLRSRMFNTYQSAPYEWQVEHSSSELLRNIHNDTAEVVNGVLRPSLDLIMATITMCVIIVMLTMNTPNSALLGLLVTGIGLYAVIRIFHKQTRQIGVIIRSGYVEMIKAIQQGFGALIDARIIGCESYFKAVYEDAQKRQAEAQLRQTIINKSTPFAMETFAIAGLLAILLILIITTSSLDAVLPIIVMLGVATLRLKQLATSIANAVNRINTARAFIPGIIKDLRELTAVEHQRRTRDTGAQKICGFKSLILESVTYAYPNAPGYAIHNISLELKRGESIGFVGSTGCGKSTLVNLLLGLLEPKSGRITVNGIDIYQDIRGWRTRLGYIQQSIYLLDDTIRANVALGVPTNMIDEKHLWEVLRSACLDEFISTLPHGLDTIIGEHGVRFSGGQRQRLGIARALYPNPEVLVMDEATSALDNKTEIKVMQAIQNLKINRTLIMIAHRLKTVEDCDRLYFLREGKIEDFGTYEELKRTSVSFREMTADKTKKHKNHKFIL